MSRNKKKNRNNINRNKHSKEKIPVVKTISYTPKSNIEYIDEKDAMLNYKNLGL